MTRRDYRYTESGLDNVILKNLTIRTDDHGQEVVMIPNINLLHKALTKAIINKPSGIIPKELRFIRTELGFTQSRLAQVVGKDTQTIGRWERGETPIEPSAQTIIRLLASEHIGEKALGVEEISKWSVTNSSQEPFVIDASDPKQYRLVA